VNFWVIFIKKKTSSVLEDLRFKTSSMLLHLLAVDSVLIVPVFVFRCYFLGGRLNGRWMPQYAHLQLVMMINQWIWENDII
jgi:hypothetical protein